MLKTILVGMAFLCLASCNHNSKHLKVGNGKNQSSENWITTDTTKGKAYWENWLHGGNEELWRNIESANMHENHNRIEQQKYRKKHSVHKALNSGFEEFEDLGISGRWVEKGSTNIAGKIDGIAYDENSKRTVAISASGQIWELDVSGNWFSVNDSFSLGRARRNPNLNSYSAVQNRIYLLAGGQRIFITGGTLEQTYYSDDGLQWHEPQGLELSWSTSNVEIWQDGPLLYLLQYDQWGNEIRLYQSQDDGLNFVVVKTIVTPALITNLTVSRWQNEVFFSYILGQSKIKIVAFANNTFDRIEPPVMDISPNTRIEIAYNNGTIYLAREHGFESDIYITENFGGNWVLTGTAPTKMRGFGSFQVDAVDKNTLYIGNVQCYVSHDNGQSWSIISEFWQYHQDPMHELHADIQDIKSYGITADKSLTLIATDGGIYSSTDKLENVYNTSFTGLNNGQYYDVYTATFNPQSIAVGAQDQSLQVSEYYHSGGMKFKALTANDGGHIDSGDGGHSFWSTSNGYVYYHQSGGSLAPHQQFRSTPNIGFWEFSNSRDLNFLWLPKIAVAKAQPLTAYMGGTFQGKAELWALTYDPISAEISAQRDPFNFSQESVRERIIVDVAISAINSDYRYVVVQDAWYLGFDESINNINTVFTSIDGGNNWEVIELKPFDINLNGINLEPSKYELGRFYISGSQYHNQDKNVYVTNDNGQSFSNVSSGLPLTRVNEITEAEDGLLFAATDAGPYAYTKVTNKWYPLFATTAPLQIYTAVEYIAALKTVRFATFGRGIWDFEISREPSMVINGSWSGIYEDPTHTGEGIMLEIVSENQAVLAWYTYGDGGVQKWLMAFDGVIDGNNIIFEHIKISSGTVFGQDFNSNDVIEKDWGALTLTFASCENAWLSYSEELGLAANLDGDIEFGRGYQNLQKLVGVVDLPCSNNVVQKPANWTGIYHNSKRKGEYLFLQQLDDTWVNARLFSYNNGAQMWLHSWGKISNGGIDFSTVNISTGGQFGPEFDENTIVNEVWGGMSIQGDKCSDILIDYISGTMGEGMITMKPTNRPLGLICQQ